MNNSNQRSVVWGLYERLDFYQGFAIIYTVGLAGHLIPNTRPLMLAITPFVLLLSGLIVLLPIIRARNARLLLWLGATGLLTFTAEAAGVATGRVFGTYHYSDVLGPALFGVPLIIAFNWVVVLLGTLSIAGMVFGNRINVVLGACVLTVVFDAVLEPSAVALGYWHWLDNMVPLQNYLAWFGLSFFSGGLYIVLNCQHKDLLPAYYFAILFVYFAALWLMLN